MGEHVRSNQDCGDECIGNELQGIEEEAGSSLHGTAQHGAHKASHGTQAERQQDTLLGGTKAEGEGNVEAALEDDRQDDATQRQRQQPEQALGAATDPGYVLPELDVSAKVSRARGVSHMRV